jgi:hypothetical protein
MNGGDRRRDELPVGRARRVLPESEDTMIKCANIVLTSVLCGLAALVALWSLAGKLDVDNGAAVARIPEYSAADVQLLYAESARLDRQAQDSARFHAILDQVERELEQGECSLAEAAEAVHAAALDHYPQYLESVRKNNEGPDDRARIALNLVRCIEVNTDARPPGTAAVVRRLRQELRASPFTQPTPDAEREVEERGPPTS